MCSFTLFYGSGIKNPGEGDLPQSHKATQNKNCCYLVLASSYRAEVTNPRDPRIPEVWIRLEHGMSVSIAENAVCTSIGYSESNS